MGYVLLKRAVGKNQKLEKLRLESFKLESFNLSWKESSEVGKNPAKLERTQRMKFNSSDRRAAKIIFIDTNLGPFSGNVIS